MTVGPYVPWTSPSRGPFRLVVTAHALRRLHERKREAWDDIQRAARPELLWQWVECSYAQWRLNVRGVCQVVIDDVRVVFCVSARMARW